MSGMDLVAALECILFVADRPVPPSRLAQVLEVRMEELEELVTQLRFRLEQRGLQVIQIAGGLRLVTRPQYASYIEKFLLPLPVKLSDAALETLAIVAYRQPITRPEIEAIRGVKSNATLRTLLTMGLVVLKGHKPVPGRPLQYGTSERFLDYFGLRDLNDLPRLDEDIELGKLKYDRSLCREKKDE
ncbi:MAG: SMC-Scp complex subunit ScpB [Candidatus Hadarchaeum sp.]